MEVTLKDGSPTEQNQHLILCPDCHEHLVVHVGEQRYRCLKCDFERDFSKPDKSKPQDGNFIRTFISLLILVLLLLTFG